MSKENNMATKKRYTVSDGKTLLNLETAEEGGYVVTSPLDPELVTEAETIEEAFNNARDAAKALRQARAKLRRRLSIAGQPRGAPREPACP
jgi:antitoxin HicB